MTPEAILNHPPLVLTRGEREFYFEKGYLLLEAIIPTEWVSRLRAAAAGLVERSRSITFSDEHWSLEPRHRPDSPRLRRATNPAGKQPVLREFACDSLLLDVVADLVIETAVRHCASGPDNLSDMRRRRRSALQDLARVDHDSGLSLAETIEAPDFTVEARRGETVLVLSLLSSSAPRRVRK